MNINKLLCHQHRLYKMGGVNRVVSKILYKLIRWYYHCDIPYSCDTSGVYFAHKAFGGVVNPGTTFGEGTYIQHGVTIGERDDSNDHAAPKIGRNVYIGAHAMVIGNVTIGDGVKIGAGAVVLKDVPAGATAVGIPAKIINL